MSIRKINHAEEKFFFWLWGFAMAKGLPEHPEVDPFFEEHIDDVSSILHILYQKAKVDEEEIDRLFDFVDRLFQKAYTHFRLARELAGGDQVDEQAN